MSYTAHADWRAYRDARRAARAEWWAHGCGGFFRPVELVAMILGFIFFFPIGLAILFWRLVGRPDLLAPLREWMAGQRGAATAASSAAGSTATGGSAWGGPRSVWSGPGAWGCGPSRSRDGLWADSGNAAFEDYKARELARLEEERRRLAEEQKAFAAFLDELRRAKDREEFDRFMASRRAAGTPPPNGPTPEPPPAA
ncbi:MAG TPA: DUF2852 domain-containing protein [Hyphomicrobiales bacterium]|nr:DUF2852 domain-containing protein [Hyphomicrobiales bacterium]